MPTAATHQVHAGGLDGMTTIARRGHILVAGGRPMVAIEVAAGDRDGVAARGWGPPGVAMGQPSLVEATARGHDGVARGAWRGSAMATGSCPLVNTIGSATTVSTSPQVPSG